ncbi:putative defense protein 3 [Lingula anatina]|uniref:Defense protein 3 n=1 Tax=Lingula anatina TaxID=7574 RepID=A0A1S3KHI6_LINAN|nr:putative defense protein 3 [Lingula anatina]|eukprot:XP_013421686.1 putative defense protein 3 [Lingula anatina]
MNSYTWILAVVFLGSALVRVQGYGNGAPPSACDSMVPGHQGSKPQTIASPYTVSVQVSSYTPGQTVNVTVRGTEDFRGLLLQARKAGTDEVVGTFQTPPSKFKFRPCPDGGANNGITHIDTSTKNNMTFMWTAPSTGVGNVQFYGTVLKEKPTYWVKLTSSVISGEGGDSNGASSLLVHISSVIGTVLLAKIL